MSPFALLARLVHSKLIDNYRFLGTGSESHGMFYFNCICNMTFLTYLCSCHGNIKNKHCVNAEEIVDEGDTWTKERAREFRQEMGQSPYCYQFIFILYVLISMF